MTAFAELVAASNFTFLTGASHGDEMVAQAKALAKGGRDEYVRVFGKEPR